MVYADNLVIKANYVEERIVLKHWKTKFKVSGPQLDSLIQKSELMEISNAQLVSLAQADTPFVDLRNRCSCYCRRDILHHDI